MKSVVLLSGGLDSTVNLYQAVKNGKALLALTFDYGQRAAVSEIKAAQKISQALNVPHQVIELPFFKTWGQSSLVDRGMTVPVREDVQIQSLAVSQKTAHSVWVPNRNGVFLNLAAGFAESLQADFVVPGFNIEEASTFPDNSAAFAQALDHSFSFSTRNKVKVKCWTLDLDKTQIVKKGQELGVPFEDIWPCYFGEQERCRECESCLRFDRAVKANGMEI